MAAKQLKTKDLWELLAQRAEIDAAIAEKRRELEKDQPRQRRSRQTKVRTVTLSKTRSLGKTKPKARSKKLAGSRRAARAA